MAADIPALQSEVLSHLKNLDRWTATTPIDADVIGTRMFRARLRKEPLGVALIIGPSELSSHCECLLAELVTQYFGPRAIQLVTGGATETGYILDKIFNHIFFTGSSIVARIVAAAAAKHLTPVVLELGGQGPAMVHNSADIDLAARRIAAAKFNNVGQICLSVDHVFVDPEVVDEFVARVTHYLRSFLVGEGRDQMCRIISKRNFDRLEGLLQRTNGTIVMEEVKEAQTRFFEPTVVRGISMQDSLLSEELFGPVLPVITASLTRQSNGPTPSRRRWQ
ncbi:aldehyde dehydrogenase (NAD+) [Microdochium nivale]|nr:aldehyde dehydrogenase (NAD+) [Microdochium nivale]